MEVFENMSTFSNSDTDVNVDIFENNLSTKHADNIDWFRLTWVVMTSLLIFTIGMLGNVTTIYIYTISSFIVVGRLKSIAKIGVVVLK